jgi:ATP-dependent DNA ligase
MKLRGPIWLMQPIPYFGEELEGEWIYEPKIDGWRLQIIRYENGEVELWGRRLEKSPNWTEKLSYIAKRVGNFLPRGSLLDAELYSVGGRRWIPSLFARKPQKRPIIYIFDVIFFEGEFVGNLPLRERRKIIEGLKLKKPFHILKSQPLVDIKEHFEKVRKEGHEGLVIKALDSKYQVGKEAPIATLDWRKIK